MYEKSHVEKANNTAKSEQKNSNEHREQERTWLPTSAGSARKSSLEVNSCSVAILCITVLQMR